MGAYNFIQKITSRSYLEYDATGKFNHLYGQAFLKLELALRVAKIPPNPAMVTAYTQINQNKIVLATSQRNSLSLAFESLYLTKGIRNIKMICRDR